MNINKHFKRFTIIIILLLLFGFCFPKPVNAGLIEDITAAPAKIFWLMEEGILYWLNDAFTNKAHSAESSKTLHNSNVSTTLKIYLTPETIIKGKFIIFDANIFKNLETNPKASEYYDYESEKNVDGTYKDAIMAGKIKLRNTVSGWYYAIRNFSIVALLSVLVYVGIRMVLSSLAQDKAKYKTMFKDWLVAICLVVVMHFFMISILTISSMITDALGGEGENSDLVGGLSSDITAILQGSNYSAKNTEGEDMDLGDAYAKIFVLGGVIVYTIIFAVKYLKREFTILFLTIIGPVACITYPIDKIGDGKAQAYNKWFAEYLYQVIVQPFHLLLYVVLIGTAAEMADANILYAIVCFAVMGPAEKFVKEMFGFKDKLGSPLGTMMKAGMARDMVSKATSRLMGGAKTAIGGKGNGGSGDNNSLPQSPTTRTIDDRTLGGAGGSDGSNGAGGSNGSNGGSGSNGAGGNNGINGSNGIGLDDADAQTIGDVAGNVAGIHALNEGEGQASPEGGETEGDRAQEIAENARALENAVEQGGRQAGLNNGENGNNGQNGNGALREGEREGNEPGRLRRAGRAIKNGVRHPFKTFDNTQVGRIHAQRMAKKYGTTSRGKRWARRIGRGAKNGIRTLAKGSLIAGAATIGAGVALATGNGAEAFAIVGATAGIAANSARKKIKGVAQYTKGAAKDYYRNDAMPGVTWLANNVFDRDKESREFNEFEANPEEQNRAILSYRKNHDGENPDNAALHSEMQDRFALSQYNLSNDQIDKAVGEYQQLRDANIAQAEQISDENERRAALASASKRAADQAALQAKLADKYKNKFDDPKKMQNAINNVTKQFMDAGVNNEALARQNAVRYLQGAARMNKETMTLPTNTQTIEAPIDRPRTAPNVMQYFVNDQVGLNDTQMERMNNITMRLVERGGLSNEQVEVIAQTSVPDGDVSMMEPDRLIEQYAINAEFVLDKGQRDHTVKVMEKNGHEASPEKVNEKMVDKLVMTHKFNIKKPEEIKRIETQESKFEKSQVELARGIASKGKGHLSNATSRRNERKEMRTKLIQGGASTEQVEKDLDNLFRLADSYVGISNPDPNTSKKKGNNRKR